MDTLYSSRVRSERVEESIEVTFSEWLVRELGGGVISSQLFTIADDLSGGVYSYPANQHQVCGITMIEVQNGVLFDALGIMPSH